MILGLHFRHMPPTEPRAVWPFVLFAYGVFATLVPWAIAITDGLVLEDDLSLRMALSLAVFMAVPMWLSAGWLAPSPYHALSIGYRILIGCYGVYAVAVLIALYRKVRR